MTPLVDTILLVALVATSACVVPMYLKLKRLDRTQAEYGRILVESGHALSQAGEAVRGFSTEGREILEALGARIDEARRVLTDLEASRQALLRDRGLARD
jgi:intergrase/recombinase